jgi:hypothetical protein
MGTVLATATLAIVRDTEREYTVPTTQRHSHGNEVASYL